MLLHQPIPIVIGKLARQERGQLRALFQGELINRHLDFFNLAHVDSLASLVAGVND